jgi:hypothetical protein
MQQCHSTLQNGLKPTHLRQHPRAQQPVQQQLQHQPWALRAVCLAARCSDEAAASVAAQSRACAWGQLAGGSLCRLQATGSAMDEQGLGGTGRSVARVASHASLTWHAA